MKRAMIVVVGLALTAFWSFPAHAQVGPPQPGPNPGPPAVTIWGNGVGNGPSYMPTLNRYSHSANRSSSSNPDLMYNGGPVETNTAVYIDFWGSDWNSKTFSQRGGTFSYTYAAAMTYIQSFFGGVGGSNWIKTDNQYCMSSSTVKVPNGTTDCSSYGGATLINNVGDTLANVWIDAARAAPSRPTNSSILAEANTARAHFGIATATAAANATVLVFSPHAKSESGFGTQWCAWHSEASVSGLALHYGYIPYMPDAGSSCGLNFVNSTDNSFGNGFFDGFSVVAGHEYEEAQTDPNLNAWYDTSGNEDADKCAWNAASTNITLGSHFFAVQPVWSNQTSGCVVAQ